MGEVWVVTTTSGHSGNRRLHPDRECQHLQLANNIRRASDAELEMLELCTTCTNTQVDSGYDWSYQQALEEHDTNE